MDIKLRVENAEYHYEATVTATYDRSIIDAMGTLIKIPPASNINRIADLWGAHSTIDVLCGAGEKLVATASVNAVNPMFQKILPAIATTSMNRSMVTCFPALKLMRY